MNSGNKKTSKYSAKTCVNASKILESSKNCNKDLEDIMYQSYGQYDQIM